MISVIIPSSGRSLPHLTQQLGAVTTQRGAPAFEVVVVDNVGSPAIADLCRRRWDAPVRYLPAPDRRGSSYARNTGAAATDADSIAFADDDDFVGEAWLAELAAAQHISPVATGFQVPVPPDWEPGHPIPVDGWYRSSYRGLVVASAGNSIFDRGTFHQIGGFDEDLPRRVDTDISIRLHLAGIRVTVADGARLCYRARDGLRARAMQAYGWGRADVDLFARYGDSTPYFPRSGPNAVKHIVLATGRLIRATAIRGDMVEPVRTLSTYGGRLRGSLAHRTLYV